jgi:hypothetical protein
MVLETIAALEMVRRKEKPLPGDSPSNGLNLDLAAGCRLSVHSRPNGVVPATVKGSDGTLAGGKGI